MDRGRDFAALKREEAEAGKTTTEEATGKTAEQPPQVPAKPTPEQIQEFTKNAAIVAKARIIPEVAKYVTNRFITALWPSEAEAGELPEVTQEQANDFTAALSEFFWMQLEDALPAILGQSRMAMSTDPIFGQVEQQTISATAFERMDGMRDKATGKPLYPDLEEMVESGTLRKVLADNPEIGKLVAGDGRNPVANQLLRYQTAYRRAKNIAAGRVSSGRPSGGFSGGTKQVVSEITGGGGSKFSQALRRDARKA